MIIYTGARGYEIFQETLEGRRGLYRVYIKKPPRFLKKTLRYSTLSGRYYKLKRKILPEGVWKQLEADYVWASF